jgi:hypothetical protein
MADIGIEQSSLNPEKWRLPSLKIIPMLRRRLRRKSREQATAEAVVNQFHCDQWCDAIEREISIRGR